MSFIYDRDRPSLTVGKINWPGTEPNIWTPPPADEKYIKAAKALASLDPKIRESLVDMLEPAHAARILKALMRDAG